MPRLDLKVVGNH